MRIWPADWPSGAPDLTNIVPWTAPNRPIHRSLGRRGINPSQKALKMPFWVADVNGDLFWPQGFRNHDNTGPIVMSTAISSGPKDFGIMTTQVQLWSVGIIWSTELRNLPQSGAKRNKSESKSSQNANLASRLALWCAGSDKCCPVDVGHVHLDGTEHRTSQSAAVWGEEE
ncbi:hypothetical protein R3P38DRAFT_2779652 [Favolaschia claudopus]|uniref:Uncharacterized protein n=1 Tax=Favolaschia claudopus TaxID=2862362 RepID=A0AAW0BEF2_9AGAR